MEVITDLERLSKQALIALVYELKQENASLKQEVQRLIERLNPPKKPRPPFASLFHRAKRPGQKKGHPGMTRATPTQIDRVVEQKLSECPQCKNPLGESIATTDHIQEDIIPARVEATCFKRHRYYCCQCRKIVTASYAPEEIPYSNLGPCALTQALLLRYVHGLPFNKIALALAQFANLSVSNGALAQSLQRLSHWLGVEAQALREAIRKSPSTHVDETGWKITGVNHWLWAFVTDKLAYFQIERSRGSGVPKEVLGEDYPGVVVSDFYSAYNRLKSPQQKCWVHLLRELRDCAKKELSEEYRRAHRLLRRIFLDARRLTRTRGTLEPVVVLHRHRLLEDRLLSWGTQPYHSKVLRRLSGRILKHHSQLLTFVKQPGILPENNPAERAIRPHVIIRHRSYQSRSPTGAATHANLMSLVQTLTLQGRAIGDTLKSAYLRHRHGDMTPVLVSQS